MDHTMTTPPYVADIQDVCPHVSIVRVFSYNSTIPGKYELACVAHWINEIKVELMGIYTVPKPGMIRAIRAALEARGVEVVVSARLTHGGGWRRICHHLGLREHAKENGKNDHLQRQDSDGQ